MRLRPFLALFTAICLALLLILRHHLRELAEVVRTYTTFYPYLGRHPKTLYRFPGTANGATLDTGNELVPQIIHQIFLAEGRDSSLSKYDSAITSCQEIHSNWTHYLWVDENATAFISQFYPEILSHYLGYKQTVQRANILRYALLHHFGGVYLDLDITCLHPLDELRHLPWLTPGAYPAGVNNAFILSRPQHAFTNHLLDGVKSRDRSWGLPYVKNMLSTGCMFFSNRWMSYVRSLPKRWKDVTEEDKVYILADRHGSIDPHMLRGAVTTPLLKHGGASSWHGWDAATIVMIGQHYRYFLAMMGVGAAFAIVAIWRYSKRYERRKSWDRGRKVAEKRDGDEGTFGMKEG